MCKQYLVMIRVHVSNRFTTNSTVIVSTEIYGKCGNELKNKYSLKV